MIKNIYLRHVLRGNRKTCPTCNVHLFRSPIYSVGYYKNATFRRLADDVCINCCDRLISFINVTEKNDPDIFIKIMGYRGEFIPTTLLYQRVVSYLADKLESRLINFYSGSSLLENSGVQILVEKGMRHFNGIPLLTFRRSDLSVNLKLEEQEDLLKIKDFIDKINKACDILELK